MARQLRERGFLYFFVAKKIAYISFRAQKLM